MKKLTRYLAMIVLAAMAFSTMVSCSTQEDDYHAKNPTAAPSVVTLDPEWTPMPAPTNSKGEAITGDPYDYINPERVYNIGEWFGTHDVYYRINSVDVHSNLEGIDTSFFSESFLQSIKEGTAWLFIIDIDIRNEREDAVKMYLSNIQGWIQHKDEGCNITLLQYIEPRMEWEDPANHACYLFQPGEEEHFTLVEVFPCEPEILEDTYYIKVPEPGSLVMLYPNESLYSTNAYVVVNKDKSEVDVYA